MSVDLQVAPDAPRASPTPCRDADRDVVHVVVPPGVSGSGLPDGMDEYHRRICAELRDIGWVVHEHHSGRSASPREAAEGLPSTLLAGIPDGSTVLIDSLVGSMAAAVARESHRLRIAVLVHRPTAEVLADDLGRAALGAASAVLTTSGWSRRWVVEEHRVDAARVHVAMPGADLHPVRSGSASGGTLVCVGPVTQDEGHDTLLSALAGIADLDWRCVCVGPLDVDPQFVDWLTFSARRHNIGERLIFVGPLARPGVDAVLSASDLLVSASRREPCHTAVIEGLSRGLPAVATPVGGQEDALGRTTDGKRPGLLVPVGDAGRLSAALRAWLTDPELRSRMQWTAGHRRSAMVTWPQSAVVISDVLRNLGQRRGV